MAAAGRFGLRMSPVGPRAQTLGRCFLLWEEISDGVGASERCQSWEVSLLCARSVAEGARGWPWVCVGLKWGPAPRGYLPARGGCPWVCACHRRLAGVCCGVFVGKRAEPPCACVVCVCDPQVLSCAGGLSRGVLLESATLWRCYIYINI